MRAAIACALAALAFSTQAHAADWVLVSKATANTVHVELDRTSASMTGAVRTGWFRWTLKAPAANGTVVTKIRIAINCGARESRILSGIDYAEDGSVIRTKAFDDTPFRSIAPDSIGEDLHAALCP